MTTFDELIISIEVEREQAEKRRDKAIAEVKHVLNLARQEGRSALSEDEDAQVEASMKTRDQAIKDIDGSAHKLARAKEAKAAEDAVNAKLDERKGGVERPAYDRVARVGMEERTYRPDTDRKGGGFLRDVSRQYLYRDPEAEHRLVRHMQEEKVERAQYLQRAVGTGAFTGLVVPQYLTDMYAPAVAKLRPFADICNKHDLPSDGMTVYISQVTTATSVALQASENSAVSETNADDTLLTESVQTAAGQQTLSRQAIDRGTGIEEVVMQDLFRRYATTLDSTLITQATTGLSAVAQAVTYTDTTPTAQELWPKIHNALANSEAALLAQATPSHVVMHSRRWYWLQSQVGTAWPFIAQPGIATQAGGTNFGTGYNMGARGILPNGLPVIVDNNIATNLGAGTNEDEIYVIAADECHLWEDPQAPVFIRAEQPAAANLGVLLVLYGYFAYTMRRYANGQSKVSGAGLVSPTF